RALHLRPDDSLAGGDAVLELAVRPGLDVRRGARLSPGAGKDPVMTVNPGFEAMEQRRGHLHSVAENSARYASSYVTYKTTGWGEFLADKAQYFTTTFTQRPSVSHSLSIDGDTLVTGRFPRVTAGVHQWVTDHDGF